MNRIPPDWTLVYQTISDLILFQINLTGVSPINCITPRETAGRLRFRLALINSMYQNSHDRLLLVLTLCCFVFLLLPKVVAACGRPPKTTVLQAYNASDIVVIARAVSMEKLSDQTEMPLINTRVTSTTMEVVRVFKGNLRVGEKMVFGQGNGIHCTWVFYEDDLNNEYLFYLEELPEDEKLWYEFGFQRSRSLKFAADDLLYLNKMNKVRGRTRISGVLDDDNLAGLSLEGQRVRIIGKNRTYVATTDKNGVYELYGVPPGTYVLEPELRFGYKVDEFHLTRPPTRSEMMNGRRPSNRVAFNLRPRSHFGIDFSLRLSNHVNGTVYDSNSKPMPWVCVTLVSANEEGAPMCNDLTDEFGRFRIDSIEAGDYVILLTYKNKTTTGMPFPNHYYPGVTEREKARRITVTHGESVSNLKAVIKR